MLIEHDDKYEPTNPQAVYDMHITIKGALMKAVGEDYEKYSENVYELLLKEGLMKEKAIMAWTIEGEENVTKQWKNKGILNFLNSL